MKHINDIVNEQLNQLNMDKANQDWMDQSREQDFNEAAGNKTKIEEDKKDYSRKDMYQKLNNYTLTAKNGKDLSFIQELKDKYEEKISKKDASTLKRNYYFNHAKSKGLHQNVSINKLEEDRALSDQRDRNNTVKEARQYYHQNYSLKKSFSKEVRPDKTGKSKD